MSWARQARRERARRRPSTVLWAGDAPGGHYQERVYDLIQSPEYPRTGVVDIYVRHDGWCAMHRGRPCNCDPAITIVPRKGAA
jgi:hypothetical protein